MSNLLDVRELEKSYGGRVLFAGAAFSLAAREKVGIIGRNGSGKSTLLRIVAGIEGYEAGTIALRRGARVGYLAQDPEIDPVRTVLDVASEGRDSVPEEAWDRSHRVEAALTRLGLEGWDRAIGMLSGGERRRVALARTLLSEPDLLLLDEPTNHLDAETALRLEETLFEYAGAVMMVTHDRYFLDRVVDRMIEVSDATLASYEGGYTEYLEGRAEREAREEVAAAKQARFLEKELAWARRSPPARTGKQKARRRRAGTMAEARRERDAGRVGTVEMQIAEPPRLGRRVIEIHGVEKSYGGPPLIRDFSDRLLAGERIGVVGPNGVGKTTLLRILTGDEPPDAGEVIVGENTRIGTFDQTRTIDPDLSVERAVSETDWVEMGGRSLHLRAYLDRFLFPPHVQQQRVRSLSGGERSRLLLARLFLQEFNLLVLDEPTNDLDLDTLRVLEDALEAFRGCVVVVTHDRYFLDRLATSLWIFEGEGRIHRHHGSWDAYLARHETGSASEARTGGAERREPAGKGAPSRDRAGGRSDRGRLSFDEKRELEGMEERIGRLEAERDDLATRLSDPGLYRAEADTVSEVTRRFGALEEEIAAAYERWMELEERG